MYVHRQSMAEFVLAPQTLGDDDGNRALLFVSKRILEKEQADLKQKFESLTQGMSQIPFFVANRSQTFELIFFITKLPT